MATNNKRVKQVCTIYANLVAIHWVKLEFQSNAWSCLDYVKLDYVKLDIAKRVVWLNHVEQQVWKQDAYRNDNV